MSTNPYDPVTTTDTTNLSDDDWGLSLPGVRYKNYDGRRSRCKGFCQAIQERPKSSAFLLIMVLGVVLLVVIVSVSSNGDEKRHPSGDEPKWQKQVEGLEFYPIPEDKSIVISFNVMNMGNNDPIKAKLDKLTGPYEMTKQLNESIYTDCKSDFNPVDKTCRFGRAQFGYDCTSQSDYGYKHAMPCILVQLNLPDHVMIRPITEGSPLFQAAHFLMKDHNDTSSVPLQCEGKTSLDRKFIGPKGVAGDAIQYYPPDGFPSYFYRERNTQLPFLKPAVMVRLTTLKDEQIVYFKCTAYGQLFKFDGSLEDHDFLTTEFAVYIKHRQPAVKGKEM